MTPTDRLAAAADGIVILKELPSGDAVALTAMYASTALLVLTGDYAKAVRESWNGHKRRFCYAKTAEALVAGMAWDGDGDPPGRWIKDKSPGQDRLNPAFGTALFDEV